MAPYIFICKQVYFRAPTTSRQSPCFLIGRRRPIGCWGKITPGTAGGMELAACRICYSHKNPFTNDNDLISPCACKGSLKYVHSTCLKYWRYKGSIFSEVRSCEQCLSPYTAAAEGARHRRRILAGAGLFIVLLYVLCTFLFSSLFRLCILVFEDALFGEACRASEHAVAGAGCRYYLVCGSIMLMVCKLFLNPSLFTVFNYIFTFWRIVQFGFLVDKGLFLLFSLYFLRELYWAVYHKIDRLYFLMKNKDAML